MFYKKKRGYRQTVWWIFAVLCLCYGNIQYKNIQNNRCVYKDNVLRGLLLRAVGGRFFTLHLFTVSLHTTVHTVVLVCALLLVLLCQLFLCLWKGMGVGVDVERCTCWVVEQQTTVACSTVQQQSFFVVTTKKFFFSHTTVPWFLGLLWCAKTTVLLLRDTNSGLDTTQHSCFFFGVSWCTGCFSSSSLTTLLLWCLCRSKGGIVCWWQVVPAVLVCCCFFLSSLSSVSSVTLSFCYCVLYWWLQSNNKQATTGSLWWVHGRVRTHACGLYPLDRYFLVKFMPHVQRILDWIVHKRAYVLTSIQIFDRAIHTHLIT